MLFHSVTLVATTVSAQNISSPVNDGQFVCSGSVLTFTCETRGSPIIAWSSDVYIGEGGAQLGFAAGANNPGDTRISSIIQDTVATLTINRLHVKASCPPRHMN